MLTGHRQFHPSTRTDSDPLVSSGSASNGDLLTTDYRLEINETENGDNLEYRSGTVGSNARREGDSVVETLLYEDQL
jgi:hypothetical protein